MIQEVDEAIEALVRRDALNGSRVEVLFDAPTREWVARRNAPTVDIYLYDIREDTSRRQIVPQLMRDEASRVAGERRMPPRRFRLSYLVTAWTQRPEDEHRLLSACLATFVRNETIPAELLSGSLASSSVPDHPERRPAGRTRPLDRRRVVGDGRGAEAVARPRRDSTLDASWSWPVAAPVMEGPTLGFGGPGIDAERRLRGGARRGRAASRVLGPGDDALQSELVRAGSTGVAAVSTGTHETRKGRGADRRKGEGAAASAATGTAPGAVEDEVSAELAGLGSGRVVRVRGVPRP